jgi:hypothetical protein
MADIVDVYSDGVSLNVGPFGCALNFAMSPATAQGGVPAALAQPVATIRMSLEHLKVMAFLIRRQLRDYERQSGVEVPIPADVLNQLRIGREDWEECWGARG